MPPPKNRLEEILKILDAQRPVSAPTDATRTSVGQMREARYPGYPQKMSAAKRKKTWGEKTVDFIGPSHHKDPIRAAEQERGVRETVDFLTPNSWWEAALYGLGGGYKATQFLGRRAAANLMLPVGYESAPKLAALKKMIKEEPLKAARGIIADIPVEPEVVRYMQHGDEAGIALAERLYSLRRSMGMTEVPRGLQKGTLSNLFSTKKTKIGGSPSKDDTYKGLIRFHNVGMQKIYDKALKNIISYEMKNPKTGEMIPYAAWKKLNPRRKNLLKEAGWGKTSVQGDDVMGGFQNINLSSKVNTPIKGAKYKRSLFEDTWDMDPKLKEILFSKKGGGYQDSWGTEVSVRQLLKQGMPLKKALAGARHGTFGVKSHALRSFMDKVLMKKPVVWKGEYGRLVMPKSVDLPMKMHKTGEAFKIKRVLDPNKIPLHELNKINQQVKRNPKQILTSLGKDGKIRLMERGPGSEKQLDWGAKVKKHVDDAYRENPSYTGFQRFNFGKK